MQFSSTWDAWRISTSFFYLILYVGDLTRLVGVGEVFPSIQWAWSTLQILLVGLWGMLFSNCMHHLGIFCPIAYCFLHLILGASTRLSLFLFS